MARKKRVSWGERIEHAIGDVADAASVAATGSQIGILELAAEDEFGSPPRKPRRKKATAKKRKPKPARRKTAKKKVAARKMSPRKKPKKKKRAVRRR